MAKEKVTQQQSPPRAASAPAVAAPTKEKKNKRKQDKAPAPAAAQTGTEPEAAESGAPKKEKGGFLSGSIGKKKVTYPTKTEMNLFYRVDKTTRPATAALYLLFALTLLLALAKFGVYDFMVKLEDANREYNAASDRLIACNAELRDYNEVLEQYTRYSYGYLTEDEAALVDRIQALGLIEDVLMRATNVSTMSINNNTVAVTFSGVSLDEVASLKKKLESNDLVTFVSVNTAATEGELKAATPVEDITAAQDTYTTMGGTMPVVANMLIYLAQVEEGGQQ